MGNKYKKQTERDPLVLESRKGNKCKKLIVEAAAAAAAAAARSRIAG